ncbi:RadC family protein [Geoalkalibacter sp.]|uniref:RadC family protein n=1 Tax=Geoalkalibacter sp. TaxID=3041440 RepID=UPI00272ECDC6|nr:DNA repair protein RadC [Geoalkalibacter sp.]
MSDTSRRIKDWPQAERPREKLLDRGPESLSDAELLALVLRTGDAATRTSALDHARLLLARFGGLRQLATASITELCQIKGIGPAKAAELQAVFQIARRFADARLRPGDRFTSSEEVFRSFHERLRDHKREVFYTLLLDSKNRVIREVPISEGSLTASIVHPREVFAPVIRESASAVLFVHNHPSGDPTPSREDIEITRRLKDVGELVGVRVLDHIVVGSDRYVSFADRGLL